MFTVSFEVKHLRALRGTRMGFAKLLRAKRGSFVNESRPGHMIGQTDAKVSVCSFISRVSCSSKLFSVSIFFWTRFASTRNECSVTQSIVRKSTT
jgi:hypothetical protein